MAAEGAAASRDICEIEAFDSKECPST